MKYVNVKVDDIRLENMVDQLRKNPNIKVHRSTKQVMAEIQATRRMIFKAYRLPGVWDVQYMDDLF